MCVCDISTDVSGGVGDSLGLNLLANNEIILAFSLDGTTIPAGFNELAVATLSAAVENDFVCLTDVVVSDPNAIAVPTSVLCGAVDFTADVTFSLSPVAADGSFDVLIQSSMVLASFQFELVDTDSNPIEIVGATGGLAGMLSMWRRYLLEGAKKKGLSRQHSKAI